MALSPSKEFDQIGLFETKGNGLPSITTLTGRFDFTPDTVSLDDMAYALSSIRRYGGHAKPRINVAQHSLTVAALAKDPFEGLMHDAHEAYVFDMPKPVKVLLPDYIKLEGVASRAVRDKVNLPHEESAETKHADLCTLFWEAYWIIHNKGEDWHRREDFLHPWMKETPIKVLDDEHTEWLFKLAVAYMIHQPVEQQQVFVRNTLRKELGIPADVDIYA